jgi:hypothetical protein
VRDNGFPAQVQHAEAGIASGNEALINNQRQKELQDARLVQAEEGIRARRSVHHRCGGGNRGGKFGGR